MDKPDLQKIHDFLLELARKAGEMITSTKPSTVDTKVNCILYARYNIALTEHVTF